MDGIKRFEIVHKIYIRTIFLLCEIYSLINKYNSEQSEIKICAIETYL